MMVFDASALLAWFFGEEGDDFVQELLDEADVPKYLHAVNAAEIMAKIGQRVDVSAGLEFLSMLQALGIEVRRDMDAALVADAAALKADHIVALGDCFGVALTRRLLAGFGNETGDPDATFVTADRGEMGKIKAGSVCPITFIR